MACAYLNKGAKLEKMILLLLNFLILAIEPFR